MKSTRRCDPSKLKQYFQKHFTAEEIKETPVEFDVVPDFIKNLRNIHGDELKCGPPEKKELLDVISKLKDGKSASDIPTACIKYALNSNEFVNEMLKLYESIWETNAIPKSWGNSKLVAIWKGPSKGKVEDPKTYRGLQIGSSLCKILIVVIINRLKTWYESQLQDQQQGFRSGRGTTDDIYVAKRVQQITDKIKNPTFVLFVDLTAAFDHVERSWLFKSIHKRLKNDTQRKLFQLIESLYSYTTTALAEAPDDVFELTAGVRQGGPESPLLYNLYMDFIMRVFIDACKKKGVKFLELKYCIPSSATKSGKAAVGTHIMDWSGYADDLLLFFDDEESLHAGLQLVDETFSRYRLSINATKTKTMILNQQYENREYPISISWLNGRPLENVKTYTYLGCEIKYNEASTGDTELNLRMDTADCKFYSLSKNMMNMKTRLSTRILMLNSLVRSRLTYSCQTWSLSLAHINKVNSHYLSFIRKMVKGGYRRKTDTWRYLLSNDDLLRLGKTIDLTTYVRRQQRNYLAHIVRKETSSVTKRLLFNCSPSHKRGRQTTLLSSVLENENCTMDEFITNATERKY